MNRRKGQRADPNQRKIGTRIRNLSLITLLLASFIVSVVVVIILYMVPDDGRASDPLDPVAPKSTSANRDAHIRSRRRGSDAADDPRDNVVEPLMSPACPLVECTVVTPQPGAPGEDGAGGGGASGVLHITVRDDLSPVASRVFLDLVESHYFDGVFIFRVLNGFVAQWGFRGEDDSDPRWMTPPRTKDEIHDGTLSNGRGTLSFAGGNPATRQVFVNLGNNQRLDKEDGRPFATVDEDISMKTVMDRLYMGYKDGQGQIDTLKRGEHAVMETFPRMSKIEQCRVVKEFSAA